MLMAVMMVQCLDEDVQEVQPSQQQVEVGQENLVDQKESDFFLRPYGYRRYGGYGGYGRYGGYGGYSGYGGYPYRRYGGYRRFGYYGR